MCLCVYFSGIKLIMARWSLVVSDQTDRSVRSYLGAIGAKKGGLSNLVEEAVKRYLLEKTGNPRQESNSQYSTDEIINVIDQGVKGNEFTNKNTQ